MSEFVWHDHYSIGNDIVDRQHRDLFDVGNRIVEAADSEELIHLFMLFYQHLREHFQSEESLMKHHRYPDYEKHVAEHDRMLDRLIDISGTVQSRQWNLADIQVFVSRWVLVHILEFDIPLGEFLRRRSMV